MFAGTAIVLDCETTGLDPEEGHRITEVAALRICDGRIVDAFESLSNCGVRIPAYISKFTGITQDMVDSAPAPAEVMQRLFAFIGGDPVIAHNAWFDRVFLQRECERLQLAYRLPEFVCSLQLARRVLPDNQSHAIGSLAARLGLPFMAGAHRGMVDATVTANIVLRLCELIRQRLAVEIVDIDELRRLACAQVRHEPVVAASAAA